MDFLPKKFLFLLPLFVLLFSCSVEKRLYTKGYHLEWNRSVKEKTVEPKVFEPENSTAIMDSNPVMIDEETHTPVQENDPLCDSIRLKNGETKLGIVQEIGIWGITYKDCDGTGPARVIEKAAVKSIRYVNGKEEEIETPATTEAPIKKPEAAKAEQKQLEGFGLAGFIFSIIGIFFAGIPLGILGIVFGAIGIGRSVSYPSKYSGKAFGVLSLLFGLIVLILTLALIL